MDISYRVSLTNNYIDAIYGKFNIKSSSSLQEIWRKYVDRVDHITKIYSINRIAYACD